MGRPNNAVLFGVLTLGMLGGRVAFASEILIKNATLLTVTKGTIKGGDLLISNGKIKAIGRNLKAPAGATIVDGTGRYVAPGIVDAHSHLCIEGGTNEGTEVVAAEVSMQDVINHKDTGIKTMLARGVTTINVMHGSANPIGGLCATIKMRWGKSADEMKFAGSKQMIKFALGENPKRVHADRGITSRLGVAETLRQMFVLAKDYIRDWDDYNKAKAAGKPAVPPRRDLKLDSIAGVIKGDIWVQCHCYRSDEIEMLLKLSDEFGFRVGALQHVLEGYKVAPEIAKRGIGASTFADNWGYKVEAYDGIGHNAAALMQWGVRTSINSDWPVNQTPLNLDSAKSIRNGGLSEDECLAMLTIHPAWQLGIDKFTGSLEVGKDADLALYDDHPLSVYSKVVATFIDGEQYFERKTDGTPSFGLVKETRDAPKTAATDKPATAPAAPENFFQPLLVPTLANPAPATFALTNARIVTVAGPVIERGTVVVQNGRITAVGNDVSIPGGVRSFNMSGLSIYPGFVNANTALGITEIQSVDVTNDTGERGPYKAHLRVSDAYNTHSAYIGVARYAGVTSALVVPRGQGWAGQAAVMHTGGRTVEEAAVSTDALQVLSLTPTSGTAPTDTGLPPIPGVVPANTNSLTGLKQAIDKALDDARAYSKRVEESKKGGDARPPRRDLNLEALIPIVDGKRAVLMSGNSSDDIEAAVKYGKDQRINVVVTGGRDADKSAAALNKAGVPVIFTALMTPAGSSDSYDKNFSAPKRMHDAGVKFCIASAESPNLPIMAGMAAAFGLPKEDALKAITLYPAQILGLGNDLGSIEVGKIADFLITDGDPIDMRTKIKRIFINGLEQPLTSKHSMLYDQFRKKR